MIWCSCGPGRCFKVCKLSKPAGCQRCAASFLWRSGGFPSGVSRLFNQRHERVLCFCSLPPKSWSHPVTIEQTPQCCKHRGTTQAWDEVRGSRSALLHHTNPRSNYIYAEVTHKTPSFIQTVYSYFMQRQKLNNFLSADRGWGADPSIKLFAITPSHFLPNLWILAQEGEGGLLHLVWNREGKRKNWINPRFQTQQPQGSRAPQSTTTQPPPHPKKKSLRVTLKRNICHFRGLHPMSH